MNEPVKSLDEAIERVERQLAILRQEQECNLCEPEPCRMKKAEDAAEKSA